MHLVHGFCHITNLDWYRQQKHFFENWIGDGFLQRKYDDQGAVTIPPAVLAPERAWDMYSHDLHLHLYHNGNLDGKKKARRGGYRGFWQHNVSKTFTRAAEAKCPIKAGN